LDAQKTPAKRSDSDSDTDTASDSSSGSRKSRNLQDDDGSDGDGDQTGSDQTGSDQNGSDQNDAYCTEDKLYYSADGSQCTDSEGSECTDPAADYSDCTAADGSACTEMDVGICVSGCGNYKCTQTQIDDGNCDDSVDDNGVRTDDEHAACEKALDTYCTEQKIYYSTLEDGSEDCYEASHAQNSNTCFEYDQGMCNQICLNQAGENKGYKCS
jgi:hypothetical protein